MKLFLVEVPVPQHLFVEYSSIKASYTRMLYNVCKLLRKKLDVDDIKEFLSCYSTSLSKKVEQCSDISGILRHVKDECSLTNIELLHSIVEEMKITEAEEHIKAYRVELNKFYKLYELQKEKQFHEQFMKEFEEELLQQKRENEEKIAALTQQHEEVTGLIKHKEELISGYIVLLTNYCSLIL